MNQNNFYSKKNISNIVAETKPLTVLHFIPQDYPVRENSPGGTENFVYLLDKELITHGNQSYVLAANTSKLFNDPNNNRLISPLNISEYNESNNEFFPQFFHKLQAITEIEEMQKGNYDIIHCHATDTMRYSQFAKSPIVHTLHFPADWFWNQKLFGTLEKRNNHLVSVSHSQKKYYESKGFNVDDVIYNGIVLDDFVPNYSQGEYLLFLGRISPTKSAHLALEVAKRTGEDLVIAGNMQNDTQKNYFNSNIKPFLTHDVSDNVDKYEAVKNIESNLQRIIFTNYVDKVQKVSLLQHAKAVIFTTEIAESLPYVCMEAMACGKPVIALARGGVPEVVEHGKTGFLGNTIEDLIAAVPKIKEISGEDCRKVVENKFSLDRMYEQYMALYNKLL